MWIGIVASPGAAGSASEDRLNDAVAKATSKTRKRDRAGEVMDDITRAAARVRNALDELRPPVSAERESLAGRIDALERRIQKLEKARRRDKS